MRLYQHRLSSGYCLLAFVVTAVMPISAKNDDRQNQDEGKGKDQTTLVLYDGRLIHDQDWFIKHGAVGPDNQKNHELGGTCSMVQSDVFNAFARERVAFEMERQDLGVWQMTWTDTVSGETTDGNHYTYRQRIQFSGITTDGRSPRPNRANPTSKNEGFLEAVPGNVQTAAFDLDDFFLLYSRGGNLIADSHVHANFRLQIPPEANDPPPAYFPFVLSGHFINSSVEVLGGQVGCDPL